MEMIGEAHEIEIEGSALAWGEMGEGEPLVLLHGMMDSHRTWRRAAPLLAQRYRLLMVDLPGHGLSGRPDAPYTLSWFSHTLARWMEAIGVERAHLCGHSYGGGVAQWMLLEQRSRIDRLALVSAGGLGRGVTPGMRFASFPFFGRKLTPLALKHLMPSVMKYASGTFGHMEPEEIERFVAMQQIPGTAMAFQRTLEGVINFFGQYMQTSQRAGEVGDIPPVALFWGAKDPIIPIRHGKTAVARSKGLTLTTYRGCGHYPHLDVPEDFARDLTEFLSDPERPDAQFMKATAKTRLKGFLGLR